jgi:hypothetical protein
MRIIQKGATSQTIYVEVLDSSSTTGARLTGLAFNTASLVASYARNGATRTAITLATQTAAGAWSSGGFVAVDGTNMPGVYRLDVPDAAFASGVDSVVITLRGATNMVQVSVEVQLTAVNFQDSVRGGMTALPNAAAEAAGGLYTRGSGAGQINQNASGQVDTRTVAMAADVVTASAIATDAIGSAELAATAVTEIAAGVWDEARASHTTAGSFGQGVASVQGNVTGSAASVTGNVGGNVTGSVGSVAAGGITASSIAADAIGASELATDAVTEIAGAVWDVTMASHLTAGTTGASLNGAGSAGDPWTTTLPGAYGAGTAGNIVGNLDDAVAAVQADTDNIQTRLPAALVSGRMDSSVGAMAAGVVTAAAVATNAIDADALAADAVTEIAAGVSVGAAPTSAQNAAAVWDLAISGHTTSGTFGNKVNGLSGGGSGGPVGSGSSAYTVTVTRPDGVTPIEGAAVWVSTDQAGTNVVAGTLYTDTLGRINSGTGFLLDSGTYFLWRQHGSWQFANPTTFTV